MNFDRKHLDEMAGYRMVDPLSLEQSVILAAGGVPLLARPRPASVTPLMLAAKRAIERGELVPVHPGLTATQARYLETDSSEPTVSQSAFREWLDKTLIPELRKDAFFFLAAPENWPTPAPVTSPDRKESIDARERSSLLRLIRALSVMAKLPARGAVTSIQAQLQELGFNNPAEATIRKLISEAGALEPDKPL